jgi:NUDIX domain
MSHITWQNRVAHQSSDHIWPGGCGYGLAGFRLCLAGASFVAVTGAMGDKAGQWRTFGERDVYSSPDVQVRQVDVELAGGERAWHHVVRLHRVALMALVDEPGRVLLVRRHRLVPDRWGWEVPGGPVDEGRGQPRRPSASWRTRPGTGRAASRI